MKHLVWNFDEIRASVVTYNLLFTTISMQCFVSIKHCYFVTSNFKCLNWTFYCFADLYVSFKCDAKCNKKVRFKTLAVSSQRHQFSTFSYFRRSDNLGCDVIMQMRPEASRLCLFTSTSLVHVQHKIYKLAVHVSTYRPCAINIPLNTLFCLLQKHPLDKKAKFLVIASIHSLKQHWLTGRSHFNT